MPEAKITYEKIEKKAQRGLLVRAPSWERLYINTALALVDDLIGLDRIEIKSRQRINVMGANPAALMESWISKVCRLITEEGFVPRRIVFEKFDGRKIEAAVHGDSYDRIRHGVVESISVSTEPAPEIGECADTEGFFMTKLFFKEWSAEKITTPRPAR